MYFTHGVSFRVCQYTSSSHSSARPEQQHDTLKVRCSNHRASTMSKTKAKELDVKGGNGPTCHCAYCDPRKDRVGADRVWAFALRNPGVNVWK